jgi:hypothetical protein
VLLDVRNVRKVLEGTDLNVAAPEYRLDLVDFALIL